MGTRDLKILSVVFLISPLFSIGQERIDSNQFNKNRIGVGVDPLLNGYLSYKRDLDLFKVRSGIAGNLSKTGDIVSYRFLGSIGLEKTLFKLGENFSFSSGFDLVYAEWGRRQYEDKGFGPLKKTITQHYGVAGLLVPSYSFNHRISLALEFSLGYGWRSYPHLTDREIRLENRKKTGFLSSRLIALIAHFHF